MKPVIDLQFRVVRALKVATLLVLTSLLVVMMYAAFGVGGSQPVKPASASPSSDKSHYDPFLPVQWLSMLDTRA